MAGRDHYRERYGNNVAILGASANTFSLSNKAVRAFTEAGHKVFPVHLLNMFVGGLPVYRSVNGIDERVDFAVSYLSPTVFVASNVARQLGRKGIKIVVAEPQTCYHRNMKAGLRKQGITLVRECAIVDGFGMRLEDFPG